MKWLQYSKTVSAAEMHFPFPSCMMISKVTQVAGVYAHPWPCNPLVMQENMALTSIWLIVLSDVIILGIWSLIDWDLYSLEEDGPV